MDATAQEDELRTDGGDAGKDADATLDGDAGRDSDADVRAAVLTDARDGKVYPPRGADVWRRRIVEAEPTVYRFTNPPDGFAISVRCAKD